ncbi:uncharacterized protein METZ01_LOCUS315077, partial [marine metagenome]
MVINIAIILNDNIGMKFRDSASSGATAILVNTPSGGNPNAVNDNTATLCHSQLFTYVQSS